MKLHVFKVHNTTCVLKIVIMPHILSIYKRHVENFNMCSATVYETQAMLARMLFEVSVDKN